jgi:glycogen operon protein
MRVWPGQDNELSWLNWELSDAERELLEFVRRMIRLRREQSVLRRRRFFQGRRIRGSDVKDLAWFEPSGQEMTDEAWNAPFVRCLGVRLAGDAIEEVDEHGERIAGETLLLLLNAHDGPIPFTLPVHRADQQWELIVDTTNPQAESRACPADQPYPLGGGSMAVLRIKQLGGQT